MQEINWNFLSRSQVEVSSPDNRTHIPPERPEEFRRPVQREFAARRQEVVEGGGQDFRLPRLHE